MFLKKLLSFLKNYWYVPVGLLIAVLALLFTRDKKSIVDWADTLKRTREQHAEDVKIISESHERQQAANDRAVKRALEVQKQVIEEYVKNERELDAKQRKRIEEITKKLKNDPRAMADEIEKTTGYRVLIVD